MAPVTAGVTPLEMRRVAGETEIAATDKRLRETALFLGFTLFPA